MNGLTNGKCNLMVSKCKVMYVGKKNPRHPYYMSSNGLKSVEVEKDLGIMITSDLKCSQQCEYAYSKANRVMGMIRRTITYNLLESCGKMDLHLSMAETWNIWHKKMMIMAMKKRTTNTASLHV